MSVQQELQDLRDKGLYRSLRDVSGRQSDHVTIEGRDVLLLCSNNYLGLADHPALAAASVAAVERFGTSSGASRLVSGSMELHAALEADVTAFKQSESALLFNSGYAANTGIIQAIAGPGDVVFCDRLNHASIYDGIRLSGARLVRYRHNDIDHLATLLQQQSRQGRQLIVTDGVFSMDGDIARLPELVDLKRRYGCLLMVDDAHGSGVLGEQGRGTAELSGVAGDVDILMGTFGKALGSYGAYAAMSVELRELMINRARSFIFSTSLPPAVLAASRQALAIVQSAEGERLRSQLADNSRLFRTCLLDAGLLVPPGGTQIVPVIVGDAGQTMAFSHLLLEAGIFAQGIRPPTVPAGSCRLRFTLMASHRQSDLVQACERIIAIARKLGVC